MLTDPTILERIVDPGRGDFSPAVAQEILRMGFSEGDKSIYGQLSAKAQDGTLSAVERLKLEDFLNISDFLVMIKAKARASLRRVNTAA